MKTHVEFRSSSFPAYPDEEEKINPGRWGKRLAEFVSAGLRGRGIAARKPAPEDWGWMIEIENDTFRLWIGCGNYEEYADGFLCFIEPSKPLCEGGSRESQLNSGSWPLPQHWIHCSPRKRRFIACAGGPIKSSTIQEPNNAINTDGHEQCSFVALLMAAGYGERWVAEEGSK